ncbi:MAG: glycosyltransferase family 2 protein [candidate division KSB1 bacterium]|nr:glycosyltransferase family 2 protein [candidate division KSB1 bacterium]MDZ7302957.1 glycosyltransferase family 2 protein [candidate division KSB1 bacterium]MDZ7312233.1 glycosyltransferase family 2 protein [candidate division KSB1 bacterium]
MIPDLSIIIITYNSRQDIVRCLASLHKFCTGTSIEIIVFDNASTDGTPQIVASMFPNVHLMQHQTNVGFARANNLAVASATGPYILFLNPDTWVDNDLATALVTFLDIHPEAAACAPRVLTPDGSVQFSSVCALPTLELLFYEQIGLSRIFPRNPRFGRYRMTYWNHDEIREVEHATGACLAIRRKIFDELGGFDENFFMYIEDVDLSYRLKRHGAKILYLPSAHVFHAGGQSGSQMAIQNYLGLYRSFYYYFHKHHPRRTVIAVKLILMLGLFLRIVALLFAVIFERFLRAHGYWRSRSQQLAGHFRLFWQHWSY